MELFSLSNFITATFCLYIGYKCWDDIKHKTGHKSDYTTLGMLGTFAGIAVGLFFFDSSNINNSIPQLLSGLKFAFVTSIVGLICSIWHTKSSKNWDITEDNPTDDLLKTIAKNIKVLGEDKESSIIGQIKLLRSDFGDFAKKVAESSAKSATKAIVEALTGVVKDFNQKITEQFGDNFKQLNEAVGRLLIWQEEYKNYMDGFKGNLELVSDAIDKNSQAVQTLPEILEQIKETVSAADKEIVKLAQGLSDMHEVGKAATKTFPEVITAIKDVADKTILETKRLSDRAEKLVSEVSERVKELTDESVNKIDKVGKQALTSIGDMGEKAKQVLPDMKKSLNTMIEDTNNQLEALGGHIVGITQKLVSNFQELSDSLESAPKRKK